jgi:hypothetical protein
MADQVHFEDVNVSDGWHLLALYSDSQSYACRSAGATASPQVAEPAR